MTTPTLGMAEAPVGTVIDTQVDGDFDHQLGKAITRDGKLYISPFGVILGDNISGQERGLQVLKDKPFLSSIQRVGVFNPVIVRRVRLTKAGGEAASVFKVIAGNRRTFALRHLIAGGFIESGSLKAQLPIYEANDLDLENVSEAEAANLIENGMRKGMDYISKAKAIERLMSQGASHEELAVLMTGPKGQMLGKEAIRQYRMLLKLHPAVQKAVVDSVIKISRAASMVKLSEEEQLKILEEIQEMQKGGGDRDDAARTVIRAKMKRKTKCKDGEDIWDLPRASTSTRKTLATLNEPEVWRAVATKYAAPTYEAAAAVMKSVNLWLEGGLTPKKCDEKDLNVMTLALKTRILSTLAQFKH